MDKIINILLLVIIFVFDPLAISLVIAANFAFNIAYPKKRYRDNLYGEKVEVKEEPNVFDQYSEEDEKRMDIIGQNGNDGEHYDELDLNEDGVIDENEIKIAKQKVEDLKKQLQPGLSLWKTNKINSQIKNIEDNLPDENTKTY